MLDNVPHPFLVLSALFFDGRDRGTTVSQHAQQCQQLSDVGLGAESFDERFLNGFRWDVSMIANADDARSRAQGGGECAITSEMRQSKYRA